MRQNKCKHEATTKIASLEQELANQGEILRGVVQKLITTQGFTKLMSSVCQATNCMVRSKTLEQVHESFDVPTRRKDWGWHPQATSVAKKAYALKVLTEPPKFALVDYICEQPRALTLEEVQKLNVDFDTSLAADAAQVIPESFEDLDKDDSEETASDEEGEDNEENEEVDGNEEQQNTEVTPDDFGVTLPESTPVEIIPVPPQTEANTEQPQNQPEVRADTT